MGVVSVASVASAVRVAVMSLLVYAFMNRGRSTLWKGGGRESGLEVFHNCQFWIGDEKVSLEALEKRPSNERRFERTVTRPTLFQFS